MLELLRLTRGALPEYSPSSNGQFQQEPSSALSDFSYPLYYLKSAICEDLFGLPESGLRLQDKTPSSSHILGITPKDQCVK